VFEYCRFKGASWTGARVKRCRFESCDDIVGLPLHKIHASLSEISDDEQKKAVCREHFAPLDPILHGSVRERDEDSTLEPFCLYRDPKRKLKQQQRDQWDDADDSELVHFLSDGVYIEETRAENRSS